MQLKKLWGIFFYNKKILRSFPPVSFETKSVREKIRTPDTLVRSQVLYPAELHAHIEELSS